jgi:hypothetical protein
MPRPQRVPTQKQPLERFEKWWRRKSKTPSVVASIAVAGLTAGFAQIRDIGWSALAAVVMAAGAAFLVPRGPDRRLQLLRYLLVVALAGASMTILAMPGVLGSLLNGSGSRLEGALPGGHFTDGDCAAEWASFSAKGFGTWDYKACLALDSSNQSWISGARVRSRNSGVSQSQLDAYAGLYINENRADGPTWRIGGGSTQHLRNIGNSTVEVIAVSQTPVAKYPGGCKFVQVNLAGGAPAELQTNSYSPRRDDNGHLC